MQINKKLLQSSIICAAIASSGFIGAVAEQGGKSADYDQSEKKWSASVGFNSIVKAGKDENGEDEIKTIFGTYSPKLKLEFSNDNDENAMTEYGLYGALLLDSWKTNIVQEIYGKIGHKNFGQITMGYMKGAENKIPSLYSVFGAADGMLGASKDHLETVQGAVKGLLTVGSVRAMKVSYTTPKVGGMSAMVSFTPDMDTKPSNLSWQDVLTKDILSFNNVKVHKKLKSPMKYQLSSGLFFEHESSNSLVFKLGITGVYGKAKTDEINSNFHYNHYIESIDKLIAGPSVMILKKDGSNPQSVPTPQRTPVNLNDAFILAGIKDVSAIATSALVEYMGWSFLVSYANNFNSLQPTYKLREDRAAKTEQIFKGGNAGQAFNLVAAYEIKGLKIALGYLFGWKNLGAINKKYGTARSYEKIFNPLVKSANRLYTTINNPQLKTLVEKSSSDFVDLGSTHTHGVSVGLTKKINQSFSLHGEFNYMYSKYTNEEIIQDDLAKKNSWAAVIGGTWKLD